MKIIKIDIENKKIFFKNEFDESEIDSFVGELIEKLQILTTPDSGNQLNYDHIPSYEKFLLFWKEKSILVENESDLTKSDDLKKLKNRVNLELVDVPKSENFQKFKNLIENKVNEHRKPYDFQLKTSFSSIHLKNSADFSAPGTGKTQTTLMNYLYYSNLSEKKLKLVIIGPKSSSISWNNEIRDVIPNSEDKIVNYLAEDNNKENLTLLNTADFFFVNYEAIDKFKKNVFDWINSNYDVYVVMDEAHRISNLESYRRKLISSLLKNVKYKTILTGTPFVRDIMDIYSMFNLLWGENDYFKKSNFEIVKRLQSSEEISNERSKAINDLKENLNGFYSLTSKESLNLDPAEDKIQQVSFTNNQRNNEIKLYEQLRRKFMMFHSASSTFDQKKISKQITGLYVSLFMNASGIFKKNDLNDVDAKPKLEKLEEIIEEIDRRGEKVIIWVNFTKSFNLVYSHLINKLGKSPKSIGRINGTHSVDFLERKVLVDLFNEVDSEMKILLANTSSIAESLSLHKAANNSIFYELDFAYSKFMQAKDRIHRLGSAPNKKVRHYIIRPIARISDVIDQNLQKKGSLYKEIFIDSNDLLEVNGILSNKSINHELLYRDGSSSLKTLEETDQIHFDNEILSTLIRTE